MKKPHPHQKLALSMLLSLCLAACAVQTPKSKLKLPETPAEFKENIGWIVANPAEAQERGEWWRVFNDDDLNRLCARAGANNTQIQIAVARLEQAHAQLQEVSASRSIQANMAGAANHQAGPLINAAGGSGTLYSVAGNLNYELDLFGKLKQAIQASNADLQSREGLLQSTKLLVQAEVAQRYLDIRALDEERRIVRNALTVYQDTLKITTLRFNSGSVAELDVVRAKAELLNTESELLTLDRQRAILEHGLAVLVCESASNFSIAESAWSATIPNIPAGIPASILTRRPDIAAAQHAVLAAQARLGVAQSAWFPNINLTASSGFASPNLGNLFSMSMRAWGLGLLFNLPIFDGGKRKAAALSANAEVDAMIAMHREKIFVALREVEDQLSSLRLLSQQAEVQKQANMLSNRAVIFAESRYKNGLASQLEVLEAKRNLIKNQRAILQVQAAQYQASVGMIRALGGGWDTPSSLALNQTQQ